MRAALRDHLLAPDDEPGGRGRARRCDARRGELEQLVRVATPTRWSRTTATAGCSTGSGASSAEWNSASADVVALSDAGQREEGARLLLGPRMSGLGAQTGEPSATGFLAHNESLAAHAGDATVVGLGDARRHTRTALALALILSASSAC